MSDSSIAINFMSGSPLNRLSWLRNTSRFVNAAAVSPTARWLLFRRGDPLVYKQSGSPVELTTQRVEKLLGPQPFFGQGQNVADEASEGVKELASARLRGPRAVFLGIWEGKGQGDDAVSAAGAAETKGDAYFALDVSNEEQDSLDIAGASEDTGEQQMEIAYTSARMAVARFDRQQAAIYASAKAMIEWNSRIQFCASCGSPVYSLWAGWKLACSSLLPWAESRSEPCPTGSGLHSHQYPRTDMVIIVGIIDQSGDKILLGRNKKFPGKFYSTLAGFIEPGETVEEAVFREIYEESGVKVHNVTYHSTQPWPYPGNLMVGFYARADSTQPIHLDLDTELLDAQWFTRAQIQEILSHPEGTSLSARDSKRLDQIVSGQTTDGGTSQAAVNAENAPAGPAFHVPPVTSIAGTLISEWVYGKAKL